MMIFLLKKMVNMNSETLKGWSILLMLGTAVLAWIAWVVLLVLFSMLTKCRLFLLLPFLHSTGEFRAKQLKLPVSRQNPEEVKIIPPSIRQKHWQKTTAIHPGKTMASSATAGGPNATGDVNVTKGAGCPLYGGFSLGAKRLLHFGTHFKGLCCESLQPVHAIQRSMCLLRYVHELRTIISSWQEVKQIKNEAIQQFSE